MRIILSALGLFNYLDYKFSLQAFQKGILEGNPILLFITESPYFFYIKGLLIPFGIIILWFTIKKCGFIVKFLVIGVTLFYFIINIYHVYNLYFNV